MLQTKALYNLLRLNAVKGEAGPVEKWTLEDLRTISTEELFWRLKQQMVELNEQTFLGFADECQTPEELAELLQPEEIKEEDLFYLIVFELWRRLLPAKPSLSVFCDELDHRISLYDLGKEEADDLIQEALANLLEVLDENVDIGCKPEDVFLAICDYSAHDLEMFLFDYILDLFDSGNALYASELIEGFSPYILEPLWFDFLRIRLLAFSATRDASSAMHRLLEADLELGLNLEVVKFLARGSDEELFLFATKKAFSLLETEEDFVQLLKSVSAYYFQKDELHIHQSMEHLIREQKSLQSSPKSANLKLFSDLVFN